MPELPDEFGRELAALVRGCIRLQADVQLLQSMLVAAETSGQPVVGWKEQFRLAKMTTAYRNSTEQHTEQLHAIEDRADVQEALRMLAALPLTRLPN
jgi:hypothetical protein